MTTLDELEAIRARHETIDHGIANYNVGWDDVNAELVHADRATLLRLLDAARAELAEERAAHKRLKIAADNVVFELEDDADEYIIRDGIRRLADALKAPDPAP